MLHTYKYSSCRNHSEINEVALFLTCVVKSEKYSGKIMYHMNTIEKASFLSHNVFMCFALLSEYSINTP